MQCHVSRARACDSYLGTRSVPAHGAAATCDGGFSHGCIRASSARILGGRELAAGRLGAAPGPISRAWLQFDVPSKESGRSEGEPAALEGGIRISAVSSPASKISDFNLAGLYPLPLRKHWSGDNTACL